MNLTLQLYSTKLAKPTEKGESDSLQKKQKGGSNLLHAQQPSTAGYSP